ncbi:MAG TPA: asparaginase [Bacteroidia bacterium]|nr:asparaginase [Bacteroidia bacterium]HNU33969.1 asparaginase [Bacteroidia bacterium]
MSRKKSVAKNILIIYTGGTIGMVHDKKTGSLKPFNFSKISSLLPEVSNFKCKIDFVSLSPLVDSSNMKPLTWSKLALLIEKNYNNYDGFIILHGTDTMAYTSSALSFMLQNLGKPVILTGSQLPIGAIRTDARRNLVTSIEIVAGNVNVPEVCVFFNAQLFRGNRVEKFTSSKFDAFSSPNYPVLAEAGVEIVFNHEFIKKQTNEVLIVNTNLNTNVAVLKLFPGLSRHVAEAATKTINLKALIIETYGSGNAPTDTWFLQCLKNTIDKNIAVINVSQCTGGIVEMGKYETSNALKKMGVISAHDMTLEAALTKTMFLFGQGLTATEVRVEFDKALAGELSGE